MDVATHWPARRLTALGLSVALGALLVVAGVLGMRSHRYQAEESRRQEILAAARQMVVNFTTLDYRHGQVDLQRVMEGATGDFEREFSGGQAQLRELITDNRAVSRGEVLEAGLVSHDADSARVLVVADSTVSNRSSPRGQRRHYRIQLDLRHEGSRWLISDLEFVS